MLLASTSDNNEKHIDLLKTVKNILRLQLFYVLLQVIGG